MSWEAEKSNPQKHIQNTKEPVQNTEEPLFNDTMSTRSSDSVDEPTVTLSNWKRSQSPFKDTETWYTHRTAPIRVAVTPVQTTGGNGYNCVLYESDDRHETKSRVTSKMAHSEEDLPDTIESLASEHFSS